VTVGWSEPSGCSRCQKVTCWSRGGSPPSARMFASKPARRDRAVREVTIARRARSARLHGTPWALSSMRCFAYSASKVATRTAGGCVDNDIPRQPPSRSPRIAPDAFSSTRHEECPIPNTRPSAGLQEALRPYWRPQRTSSARPGGPTRADSESMLSVRRGVRTGRSAGEAPTCDLSARPVADTTSRRYRRLPSAWHLPVQVRRTVIPDSISHGRRSD
jgi:hypothetical protein